MYKCFLLFVFLCKKMLISILLLIFVICIGAWFVLMYFRREEVDEDGFPVQCREPDPTNCSKYYNCLGALVDCSMENRFNATTKKCEHYYFTSCGNRHNPEYPSPTELCHASLNGQTSISRFPQRGCHLFTQCGNWVGGGNHSYEACSSNRSLNFDIHTRSCRPIDQVDCGRRVQV
jgi:hypothetical protein